MLSKEIHRNIYLLGLVIVGVGLPLSLFLLSVGQILLFVNWLLEGNFRDKFRKLRNNRNALAVFLSIYLIHIMGLWNTANLEYGLVVLRLQLPLLVLPLVIGTSVALHARMVKYIGYFFIAAVFIGTMVSMIQYIKHFHDESFDMRYLSVFISHIRFALQINLAIFISIYYLMHERRNLSRVEKTGLVIISLWFMVFLTILQTLTGIVVFIVVSCILIITEVWSNRKRRWAGLAFLFLFVGVLSLYLNSIAKLVEEPVEGFGHLKTRTINGNDYYNDTTQHFVENNHYIWVHISDHELAREWNKRSDFNYYGKDKKDQLIKHTLIRYLTSKGLTKDSAGISQLSDKDIRNIENSMSNYLFEERSGLFKRFYQLFWEIDIYQKGGVPSNHTILQRLEYLRIGTSIACEHFWFGVGTGDVRDAFEMAYNKSDTELEGRKRRLAHNQYLTHWLTFGIFGFIWIWLAFFYPVIALKKWKDRLAMVFLIIALLSMIHEDTLGSHAGITFVAFFYAFFIFGQQKDFHASP